MPFTLAHPAAILPFLRQPFVPIALVAGALAPDLPYFMRVPVASGDWYEPLLNGSNSHDFAQILTVGLPLSLVVAGFLWLVSEPLRWATPDQWLPNHKKLGRDPSSARIALWIFYSLMLGLFTHIAWDSFTHAYGWVVQQLPFLSAEIISGFPLYRILQHASTLAGLVILALWYLKRLKANPAKNPRTAGTGIRLALLAAVIIVPAAVVAALAIAGEIATGTALTAESFLWVSITSGGMALLIALAAFGAIWRLTTLGKKLVTTK